MKPASIEDCNRLQAAICDRLCPEITEGLPAAEAKIRHAHPVWFLAGNPVVDCSKLKAGIRPMF